MKFFLELLKTAMSEDIFPKNWTMAKLSAITNKIVDGTHFTPHYQSSGVPFISVKDIYDGKIHFEDCKYISMKEHNELSKRCKPERNDILITKSGTIGRIAVIKKDIEFSLFVSVALIKPFKKYITPDFVAYALENYINSIDIQQTIKGGVIKNFHIEDLKEVPIPMAPLEEQRRIVSKIEELFTKLDAGVESLKKAKLQLKRYRRSVLKAAFEGKLTEEWRRKHQSEIQSHSILIANIKKAKKLIDSRLDQGANDVELGIINYAREWPLAYLPEVGELRRGMSKHRPRDDKKLYGGKYPFIQTGDIRNSKGVIRDYAQTYSEIGLKQSRLWPIGTLCITIAANIAETAILGIETCFPDSVVGFVANKIICDAKFVYFLIQNIKSKLDAYAPATAQKNINVGILSRLAVPIPCLSEQQQIITVLDDYFSVVENLETTIGATLNGATNLRRGILTDAFLGKLVSQDSNDEPAQKLLERIRKQKATSTLSLQLVPQVE